MNDTQLVRRLFKLLFLCPACLGYRHPDTGTSPCNDCAGMGYQLRARDQLIGRVQHLLVIEELLRGVARELLKEPTNEREGATPQAATASDPGGAGTDVAPAGTPAPEAAPSERQGLDESPARTEEVARHWDELTTDAERVEWLSDAVAIHAAQPFETRVGSNGMMVFWPVARNTTPVVFGLGAAPRTLSGIGEALKKAGWTVRSPDDVVAQIELRRRRSVGSPPSVWLVWLRNLVGRTTTAVFKITLAKGVLVSADSLPSLFFDSRDIWSCDEQAARHVTRRLLMEGWPLRTEAGGEELDTTSDAAPADPHAPEFAEWNSLRNHAERSTWLALVAADETSVVFRASFESDTRTCVLTPLLSRIPAVTFTMWPPWTRARVRAKLRSAGWSWGARGVRAAGPQAAAMSPIDPQPTVTGAANTLMERRAWLIGVISRYTPAPFTLVVMNDSVLPVFLLRPALGDAGKPFAVNVSELYVRDEVTAELMRRLLYDNGWPLTPVSAPETKAAP